jgi:hypothetical protein
MCGGLAPEEIDGIKMCARAASALTCFGLGIDEPHRSGAACCLYRVGGQGLEPRTLLCDSKA